MNGVKPFFDTNVLIYLMSADVAKAARSAELIAAGGLVSVQVLNEFVSVASRKLGLSIPEINDALAVIRDQCVVVPLDVETHELGLPLLAQYRLAIYDALIVAAAQRAGCTVLFTEDLSDGQAFGEVRVCNPLRTARSTMPVRFSARAGARP